MPSLAACVFVDFETLTPSATLCETLPDFVLVLAAVLIYSAAKFAKATD